MQSRPKVLLSRTSLCKTQLSIIIFRLCCFEPLTGTVTDEAPLEENSIHIFPRKFYFFQIWRQWIKHLLASPVSYKFLATQNVTVSISLTPLDRTVKYTVIAYTISIHVSLTQINTAQLWYWVRQLFINYPNFTCNSRAWRQRAAVAPNVAPAMVQLYWRWVYSTRLLMKTVQEDWWYTLR